MKGLLIGISLISFLNLTAGDVGWGSECSYTATELFGSVDVDAGEKQFVTTIPASKSLVFIRMSATADLDINLVAADGTILVQYGGYYNSYNWCVSCSSAQEFSYLGSNFKVCVDYCSEDLVAGPYFDGTSYTLYGSSSYSNEWLYIDATNYDVTLSVVGYASGQGTVGWLWDCPPECNNCVAQTPVPVPDPTPSPSHYPTPKPSLHPSFQPTQLPSAPSPAPFPRPTPFVPPPPTQQPTPLPTPYFTLDPTPHPTVFPSFNPTPQPSPLPTQNRADLNILALEALYTSTGGERWISKINWMDPNADCKTWYGVECVSGLVTQLILDDNGLTGTLPTEIGYLAEMTTQFSLTNDLGYNALTGTIPSQIGMMSKLAAYIHLSSNSLTGSLPSQLGLLTGFVFDFNVNGNSLTGNIPSEVGSWTDILGGFYLASNSLSGSLPSEIGRWKSFQTQFFVTYNSLCGDIPDEVNNMFTNASLVYTSFGNSFGTTCEITPSPSATTMPTLHPTLKPTPEPTTEVETCAPGWTYYDEKCYNIASTTTRRELTKEEQEEAEAARLVFHKPDRAHGAKVVEHEVELSPFYNDILSSTPSDVTPSFKSGKPLTRFESVVNERQHYHRSMASSVATTTWQQCNTTCGELGTVMPCVATAADNAFMVDLASAAAVAAGYSTVSARVYLGYYDMGGDRTFDWIEDTCSSTYTNWDADAPNNGGDDDQAVGPESAVLLSAVDGTWNDVLDDTYQAFCACAYASTAQPTSNPTKMPVPSPTMVPIPAPTKVPIPSPTKFPTQVPIPLPTKFPTQAPIPAPTKVPIPLPTKFPTQVPIPAPTKVPIPSPTKNPTPPPTPGPTYPRTPSPSSLPFSPTHQPTPYPTPQPTVLPNPAPTNVPIPSPTKVPIPAPTKVPIPSPTKVPVPAPTNVPIPSPTKVPISAPTNVPIPSPTKVPIPAPSVSPGNPTPEPSFHPTPKPSVTPSSRPIPAPTSVPIPSPTVHPTPEPTSTPTSLPIPQPSALPVPSPSQNPLPLPTSVPLSGPTMIPVATPTKVPIPSPSTEPTLHPSFNPTSEPTPLPTAPSVVVSGKGKGRKNSDNNTTTAASVGGGAVVVFFIVIGVLLYKRNKESTTKGSLRGSVEVPMEAFGGFDDEEDSPQKPTGRTSSRPGFFSTLSSSMLGIEKKASIKEEGPVKEDALDMYLSNSPSDWVKDDSKKDRRVTSPDALPKSAVAGQRTASGGGWASGMLGKRIDAVKASKPAPLSKQWSHNPMSSFTNSEPPPSGSTTLTPISPSTTSTKARPQVDREWSNNPMNTFVPPPKQSPSDAITDL
jgi:hypothetical protein